MWKRSFSSPASISASTRDTCRLLLRIAAPPSRIMAAPALWRLRCASLDSLAAAAVPALIRGIKSPHVGDSILTCGSKASLTAEGQSKAVEHTCVPIAVFDCDGLDQLACFACDQLDGAIYRQTVLRYQDAVTSVDLDECAIWCACAGGHVGIDVAGHLQLERRDSLDLS